MDCANFDALDDRCKECLSGGTSVNPKEQECYEIPVKKAHHINFCRCHNSYLNICYLPTAIHIKIHTAARRGLVAKEDINTLEKLMLYIDTIMAA